MDTIFALSSGALPAGVAVVRISGPDCRAVTEALVGTLPPPRIASLRTIRDQNNDEIDTGLILWFTGPGSFTGEDSAEFHLHGGRAVVDKLSDTLVAFSDVRVAEPGEFSRRAFLNGKFDLTSAEGLADLIASETDGQRILALEQSSGSLQALYSGWQDQLLHARAMLEADIDFADEDDVPGSVADTAWSDMADLATSMTGHLEGEKRGRAVREGYRVAIIGAPNVGKSSLLNALAGSDVAIVSAEPGTTRDAISVRLSMGGQLVVLTDTAGIRDTAGVIEVEGIRRARMKAEEADLVLHLSDTAFWNPEVELGLENVWRVRSKTDLSEESLREAEMPVSIRSRSGYQQLLDALENHVKHDLSRASGGGLPTRKRHIDNVRIALNELRTALSMMDAEPEIRAEHLRLSATSLGKITGQYGVEDVLGVIFSEFCIGK